MTERPTKPATVLSLRPLRHSDIPAGLHLCRACHWNQLADDWVRFVRLPGGGGHVAVCDGNVLGTVAYLRYSPAFSWIAMMLVDPASRRAGIALRLMESALEALRGETCIRLDATPAGEPLYRQYGFTGEYSLLRVKLAASSRHLVAVSGNARPLEPVDLPKVLARDRMVFGADRSTLLASIYQGAPQLAWISGDAYCFGRPGHLYNQLGPIVADDSNVAVALASRCLASQAGKPFAIDTPQHSPDWLRWLESAGFEIERPFLRMRLGDKPVPEQPEMHFAITGPDFG